MPDKRIFIVEDETIIALDLRNRLESLGYKVIGMTTTGEDAVFKARALLPDLIMMDIRLRGEMDGIEAAKIICSEVDIPVVFLTAFADEVTLQRAQLTKPFGYVLKPFDERELSVTVEMALYRHHLEKQLRESEERWRKVYAEKQRVEEALTLAEAGRNRSQSFLESLSQIARHIKLQSEPDEIMATIGIELARLGISYALLLLSDQPGREELVLQYTSLPEQVIVDVEQSMGISLKDFRIPKGKWFRPELVEAGTPFFIPDATFYLRKAVPLLPEYLLNGLFRSRSLQSFVPFLFLPMTGSFTFRGGLVMWGEKLNSQDTAAMQIFADQIAVTLENAQLHKRTQQVSILDPKTGTYNRQYFMEFVERECNLSERYKTTFSIILFQLDEVKQIIKHYGVPAIDKIMFELVSRIRPGLRTVDVVARYGERSFAILLPETSCEATLVVAERIRTTIKQKRINLSGQEIDVTACLGVSQLGLDCQPDTLITSAEQALYKAQQSGASCVRWK